MAALLLGVFGAHGEAVRMGISHTIHPISIIRLLPWTAIFMPKPHKEVDASPQLVPCRVHACGFDSLRDRSVQGNGVLTMLEGLRTGKTRRQPPLGFIGMVINQLGWYHNIGIGAKNKKRPSVSVWFTTPKGVITHTSAAGLRAFSKCYKKSSVGCRTRRREEPSFPTKAFRNPTEQTAHVGFVLRKQKVHS